MPDEEKWQIIPCRTDTPAQRNGYDCGIFTCMYADLLSTNRLLEFTQNKITKYRQQIVLAIIKGKASGP
jgi:sentrin-specific protease 1